MPIPFIIFSENDENCFKIKTFCEKNNKLLICTKKGLNFGQLLGKMNINVKHGFTTKKFNLHFLGGMKNGS